MAMQSGTTVVRPFGKLGSRYLVNGRGLACHKAAWLVAILLAVAAPFVLQAPSRIQAPLLAAWGIGFLLVVGLTLLVARTGRKVE